MKPVSSPLQAGAALIMTLILVTAIALVVVSFFAITRQEATISNATVSNTRADLGERAAFEDAGALLRSLTANDHYLVSSVLDDVAGSGRPTRYTFISTPGATEVTHSPLFTGGVEQQLNLPDLNQQTTSGLADGPVAPPEVKMDGSVSRGMIETFRLSRLLADGGVEVENNLPDLAFREIAPVGNSPFITRYSYWIEDLEGYPNIDVVGTWTDQFEDGSGRIARDYSRFGYSSTDSRIGQRLPLEGDEDLYFQFPASFRGQSLVNQVAPGLSTREITLQPWRTGSLDLARHPYAQTARMLAERNLVASAAERVGAPHIPESGRFAAGLQPYRRIPVIPFAHGYADEGKPRYNLNTFVADRNLGIAEVVERNLPGFSKRKGGFPEGEDYVGTLAANAIDYADGDSRPSLPGNTTSSGSRVFRGVDSYCPVNEFFVKFEYVGYESSDTEYRIVFEATPYVEFWNTSNRTAVMEQLRLKFRFLERIRFKTNSVFYDILDTHRVLDEPFANPSGIGVTVTPNGYRVSGFGIIRWKVPVPRDPRSPIAFPVVQDLRGVSAVTVRAHYELYLGNDRIDLCGRPDPADLPSAPKHGFFFSRNQPVMKPGEFFMRLATPSLGGQAFGFNAGNGSHLGDSWMTYLSRSTFDDPTYRLKGSPGTRNFDSSKVSGSRPGQMGDQTRVRDWPDRGYETAPGPAFPSSDLELPDTFNSLPNPDDTVFAPWRISNLGRFHSVTELGHLHDPVMWVSADPSVPNFALTKPTTFLYNESRHTTLKSLPISATPGKMWGGGNTLRIGRPEHKLFDQPGMRASQWLDLFHAGFTGTNLSDGESGTGLYTDHDPRDHQPPPAASDPVESETQPYAALYDSDLNAQGRFELIYGHLNLNTAPTLFEIETLLRGPFASSDIRLETDHFKTPAYSREGVSGTLRSGLKPDAIPKIAAGLFEARPFYSPSHLARVLSELIDRYDALPDHHNDAEAEETFARIFNTTTFSSRHFRIFTYAEVSHRQTGEISGRTRRVHEVFLRPVRNATGGVVDSKLEVISSRDL